MTISLTPRRAAVALCALLACLFVAAAAASVEIAGSARVIDGDTIVIGAQHIRLFGIDAPEGKQTCDRDGTAWRCGEDASRALAQKIGRQPVSCEQRDIDRYHRVVAVCHLGSIDLNGWMVGQGWAVAYRRYSSAYVTQESTAKRERLGIWASTFEMPWEWRQHAR